jgi:hypothetical protein
MPGPLKGVEQHKKTPSGFGWCFFCDISLYLAMRKRILIFLIIILNISCSTTRKEHITKTTNCQEEWRYFKLGKPVHGIVLNSFKGICGYFYFPSVTIIATVSDTIRVIGPCYPNKFNISDSIIVSHMKFDKYSIRDSLYDCTIKKTCTGIIVKIK